MELNNFHNIEFDLYKLKGVDVFDIFKSKVESKLRENNIKYDIKMIDENEMIGGSNSTYPYNYFEDTIDSIIGRKIENKQERKDMFDFLFSTNDKNKDAINNNNKENGFFDYFKNKQEPVSTQDVKSEGNTYSKFNLFDTDLFKQNKNKVKDVKELEKSEEIKPSETQEQIVKPEENEVFETLKTPDEATLQAELEKQPVENELFKSATKKEDDNETVKEFIKSQSTFIKVIITIYHDEKNEKILPTILGIKKWGFS